MLLLPKGVPLHTGLPATAGPPPELLAGLARRQFTGYASYAFASSQGILLFEAGRLIDIVLSRGGQRLTGLAALTELFESIINDEGTVDVYRLSSDLALCLQALLGGEALYTGQELKLLNVKALVERVKSQRLSGCLRIYTDARCTLIFYREGVPLGFFHDGSETLEASATESQQISQLPGAKVDVHVAPARDPLQTVDLLEMLAVGKLWESVSQRHAVRLAQLRTRVEEAQRRARESRLHTLEETLLAIGEDRLGKLGATLVEKVLAEQGGCARLQEPAHAAEFLAAVEKGARLLTGASGVKALLAQMRDIIQWSFRPQTSGKSGQE